MFYRLTFTEHNGKTLLTLTGEPVHASEEEIEAFHSINVSVQEGFDAMFNQLTIYLDNIQK